MPTTRTGSRYGYAAANLDLGTGTSAPTAATRPILRTATTPTMNPLNASTNKKGKTLSDLLSSFD